MVRRWFERPRARGRKWAGREGEREIETEQEEESQVARTLNRARESLDNQYPGQPPCAPRNLNFSFLPSFLNFFSIIPFGAISLSRTCFLFFLRKMIFLNRSIISLVTVALSRTLLYFYFMNVRRKPFETCHSR